MTWLRRAFAGGFALLGARLALGGSLANCRRNQKGGPGPPFFTIRLGARAELSTPPGQKNYFFFPFLAFFAFFAFFAFLAIVSSQGLMD